MPGGSPHEKAIDVPLEWIETDPSGDGSEIPVKVCSYSAPGQRLEVFGHVGGQDALNDNAPGRVNKSDIYHSLVLYLSINL